MKSVSKTRASGLVLVAAVVAIASAAYGDPPIELTDSVPIDNLSGAAGSETVFQFEVPFGMYEMMVLTQGGTGDVDVYVKRGTPPTTTDYDYCDAIDGNLEAILINRPFAGTWYILLHGKTAYAGVSLWAGYNDDILASLENGVPVTGISGSAGRRLFFTIDVPAGRDSLEINTWGGSGDADLYVKYGSKPSRFNFDDRSVNAGNDETVTISHPAAGTWYILLRGDSDFDGVTLRATYGVSPSAIRLEDEEPITGLSALAGSREWYVIDVPNGRGGIMFRIFGGTGDCDMYIKRGAKPTETDWDYRPTDNGNTESISIGNPAGGKWFVLLKADEDYSGVTLEADYWAPTTDDVMPLHSGVPVTGIAGGVGGEQFFSIVTPVGAKKLEIKMSGGSGDADLYVKRNSLPTTEDYDFRPYKIGNNEIVTISDPAASTWYILIRGYMPFAGVTLVATYDALVPDETIVLKNGEAVTDLSGERDNEKFFKIEVPEGQVLLTITMQGGVGDADLYVRKGARPSTKEWDYRPYLHGNDETLEVADPAAATWYVMIHGYHPYSGVSLQASFTAVKEEPKTE